MDICDLSMGKEFENLNNLLIEDVKKSTGNSLFKIMTHLFSKKDNAKKWLYAH